MNGLPAQVADLWGPWIVTGSFVVVFVSGVVLAALVGRTRAAVIAPDELRRRLDAQDIRAEQQSAQMEAIKHELGELRRGVVGSNAQAAEARRIAESVAPTLAQIQGTLTQVAADVTVLRSAAAGAEAAERILGQQRRAGEGGGVTVNTAAPGMHFSGDATIHGPAIGGNVGTLGPAPPTPPKLERPHTI